MNGVHMRYLCLGMLLVAVLGCSQPAAVTTTPQGEERAAARRSTSFTIVLQNEVGAFSTRLGAVGAVSVPSRYFHEFVNAYLTTRDTTNELVPWLATELPTLD